MTNSSLFKTLLVCLVQAGSVFFVSSATAQNTSEVGIGVGGLVYKGDLAPSYQFRNNRPALTAFYRRDISAPITLRGAVMGGLLRADDANVKGINGNTAPLSAARRANMKGSLLEVSGALEYNFFDFHNRKEKIHFTPYVMVGVAGFYANTTTQSSAAGAEAFNKSGNMLGIAIPAGFGLKLALSRHWNLGLEAGARKTFTDELDHASTQTPVLVNSHDQDWYFYNGVSISYTFYKIHCPDSYKENKQLLR
ncbi:Outer membrane protein beta-barrel domain-containing protein [Hymenobacter daecheongensis DSM 21074]|uniref:Outer membrane protein beta-barrel domain-containing protein n=1 Tax=Hymenobacter daecheongensis DSM 21074 TaxID=1121955 RepID=A0A1M6A4E2_9BACT|nr:DUF6089 family protein [Hymenobacter daecheongensis]SHI31348.1 Outer membrane protein beta-barrel domain-containing protein [Hymenobacter daecheongensis DSM 21074]